MAEHNVIGKIGEDLAEKWLVSRGMTIIERNYRKKWGEIDIVALESGRLASLPVGQACGTHKIVHFVEVKSVSYETKQDLDWAVSHGTYRPEDNVHRNKQDRLKRAIQTWVAEHTYTGKFQIDIVTVRIVSREKYSRVKIIENVVF